MSNLLCAVLAALFVTESQLPRPAQQDPAFVNVFEGCLDQKTIEELLAQRASKTSGEDLTWSMKKLVFNASRELSPEDSRQTAPEELGNFLNKLISRAKGSAYTAQTEVWLVDPTVPCPRAVDEVAQGLRSNSVLCADTYHWKACNPFASATEIVIPTFFIDARAAAKLSGGELTFLIARAAVKYFQETAVAKKSSISTTRFALIKNYCFPAAIGAVTGLATRVSGRASVAQTVAAASATSGAACVLQRYLTRRAECLALDEAACQLVGCYDGGISYFRRHALADEELGQKRLAVGLKALASGVPPATTRCMALGRNRDAAAPEPPKLRSRLFDHLG